MLGRAFPPPFKPLSPAPLALLAAVGASMPVQAAIDTERLALQARVQAVRAALAEAAPAAAEEAAPLVAQAANWTNWPKWSKWSNWANK